MADEVNDDAVKPRRGGFRPGAGRKKKGHVSPSVVAGVDLESALAAEVPDKIEGLAQRHAAAALATLVKLLIHGKSEGARINAANLVLDRGYGKPAVGAAGELLLPFLGTAPGREVPTEIREEARKHAQLAIAVLEKIAANGESDMARAAAARSLLDRGLGTVATATVPDDRTRAPLGKKEEASAAARQLAVGRYATPPAPRVTVQ